MNFKLGNTHGSFYRNGNGYKSKNKSFGMLKFLISQSLYLGLFKTKHFYEFVHKNADLFDSNQEP